MIKKLIQRIQKKIPRKTAKGAAVKAELKIIPREKHNISREHISEAALKVLYTLKKHNHAAFLVGGSVRDLLLGLRPKDFDIATDATPEELTRLFRNAMIIGRRFKIVHIRFGREIIEVTTFRGHHHHQSNPSQSNSSGMLLRDNVYGTVEEDAIRRDFTVNALYYNVEDYALHDYTQGLDDIRKRRIHIIGNAEQRYREDPVRMLRAIRLAAKLDFSIEDETAAQIPQLRNLLAEVPPARLFDEMLKLFTAGHAEPTFRLLEEYGVFDVLFPQTAKVMTQDESVRRFLELAMAHTDERIRADKRTSPAYLFATLLWPAFVQQLKVELARAHAPPHFQCVHIAADTVISQLVKRISLPRRFSAPMKEIWQLQFRLDQRAGSRAQKMLEHPRFRAAYDFVLLREESGEDLGGLGAWWTDYQDADEPERQHMADALARSTPKSGVPRRRRRRRS